MRHNYPHGSVGGQNVANRAANVRHLRVHNTAYEDRHTETDGHYIIVGFFETLGIVCNSRYHYERDPLI